MSDMVSFSSWFFTNLPDFLLSEPIKYFVGLVISAFIIKLILSLCGLSERRYK